MQVIMQKKCMPRLLAVLMAALMAVGMLPVSSAKAEEDIVDVVDDNAARIVLETDVTEAASDCIMLAVYGTYYVDSEKALARINEIRKEACDQGVPNPNNPAVNLTPADYVPIKWSYSLEKVARIRAMEGGMAYGFYGTGHKRLNGREIWGLEFDGIGSFGEILAYNFNKGGYVSGINQWYGEKDLYISTKDPDRGDTGHYAQMIDPTNAYIGLGDFYNSGASFPNTLAGEFNKYLSSADETAIPTGDENIYQKVEVLKSSVANYYFEGASDMKPGDTKEFVPMANVTAGKSGKGINMLVMEKLTYASSNDSVATVGEDGVVSAKAIGSATITASLGGSQIISYELAVKEKVDPTPDPTPDPGPGPTPDPDPVPDPDPTPDPIPDESTFKFTFTDVRGQEATYDSKNGNAKILLFGGISSCMNTGNSLDHISKISEKITGKCDIYAFDIKDNSDTMIRAFLSTHGISKNIYCSSTSNSDIDKLYKYYSDNTVFKSATSFTMPLILYISNDTTIKTWTTGASSEADILANIKKIVAVEGTTEDDITGKEFKFSFDDVRGGTSTFDTTNGKAKLVLFTAYDTCNSKTIALDVFSDAAKKIKTSAEMFTFYMDDEANTLLNSEYSTYSTNKNIKIGKDKDSNIDGLEEYCVLETVCKDKVMVSYTAPILICFDDKGNIKSWMTGALSTDAILKTAAEVITIDAYVDEGIHNIAAGGKLNAKQIITQGLNDTTLSLTKFTSSDKSVATVNAKGVVKGKGNGKATITAYAKVAGVYKEAGTLEVNVSKPIFTVSTNDMTYIGQKRDFGASVTNLPEGQTVRWSVPATKSEVASINPTTGVLTANGNGKVKVTCLIGDDKYAAVYTFTVKVKLPKVKSAVIPLGETKTVSLKNVSAKTQVKWLPLDEASKQCISVSSAKKAYSQKVTALNPGSAKLTAEIDGHIYTISISVE